MQTSALEWELVLHPVAFVRILASNLLPLCHNVFHLKDIDLNLQIYLRGPQTRLTHQAKRTSERTCRAEEPWSSPALRRCSSPSSTAWFHCGTLTTPAHLCPRYPAGTHKAQGFVKQRNTAQQLLSCRDWGPHRRREQSGEIYFPGFSGGIDDHLLHAVLHRIHVLLHAVFGCQSRTGETCECQRDAIGALQPRRRRWGLGRNPLAENRQTTEKGLHFLPFILGDANARLRQSVVHDLRERRRGWRMEGS